MTTTILPPSTPRGKRGIFQDEFRRRLGGISYQTLWRLEKTDPRFPKPGYLRGHRRIWDDDQANAYVALVTSPDEAE
jgi:hypothetical protein